MKYLEGYLASKRPPAAVPQPARSGTDRTDTSSAGSPTPPSVGFVGSTPGDFFSQRRDQPLPEWAELGVAFGHRHPSDDEFEAFEERAAIIEYDGGVERADAEARADLKLALYFRPSAMLD